MHSDQIAFLRAAAENPDDDTVRLVYADWLQERGDDARAEFIRLDVKLAVLSRYDPARDPLEARREQLLAAHAGEWLAELPAFEGVSYREVPDPDESPAPLRFHRGLPALAVGTWDALTAFGEQLLNEVPLRGFLVRNDWSGVRVDPADFFARPWLARLRELEIEYASSEAVCTAIAASPNVANLTALRIKGAHLEVPSVRELVSSAHLGRLERLELSGHDTGEEEIELVGPSVHLPRLKSFTSHGVQMSAASVISHRAVEAFANAPVIRLRELRLPWHSCDDRAASALGAALAFSGLEVLDLSGNGPLGDSRRGRRDPIEYITSSRTLTNLRELNLNHVGFGDRGVRLLADSPVVRHLRALDLSFTDFADEGATALALSEHLPDDCRLTVGWYNHWRRVTDLGLGALRERFRNLNVIEPNR